MSYLGVTNANTNIRTKLLKLNVRYFAVSRIVCHVAELLNSTH